MITAVGALVSFAATVVYTASADGRLVDLGWALGVAGFVVLALGLALRFTATIPWAVLLAGAGYLVGRAGHGTVDGWAAVIGVLLLASAELASWSMEHDARIFVELAVIRRRSAALGALLAGGLLVDFLLLGTAGVQASAGVALAAFGVAAAVAAVAVVLRLARA